MKALGNCLRDPVGFLLPLLLLWGSAAAEPPSARTFHVDCSASVSGTATRSAPWRTLAEVEDHVFHPGDRILFRSGSICRGGLDLHGVGLPGAPIRVSRYGSGPLPVLDGEGKVSSVVRLHNVEQWEIEDLELHNDASTPSSRAGLIVENASGRTLHHVWLRRLVIASVRGWPGGWYSTDSGIGIQTDHTPTPSAWDDIRIEGNTFRHIDRIAIAVTPDHDGIVTGLTTRLAILNNHIEDSGGDDILVVKGDGALIAGNHTSLGGSRSVHGCPPAGTYCNKASASIWIAGSRNTNIRENHVNCYLNELDGQAFDVDWGNSNTLIERNLSTSNRGGFLLLMPSFDLRSEPASLLPSSGTVIRYNVSENDTVTSGCMRQPNAQGPASVIHFVGDVPNGVNVTGAFPNLYNNTILMPAEATADVIGSRKGPAIHGAVLFVNNIVVNRGSGGYVATTGSKFQRNLFFGSSARPLPAPVDSIDADPKFAGPFLRNGLAVDAYAFRLQPGSPARGVSVAVQAEAGTPGKHGGQPARMNLGSPVLPQRVFGE